MCQKWFLLLPNPFKRKTLLTLQNHIGSWSKHTVRGTGPKVKFYIIVINHESLDIIFLFHFSSCNCGVYSSRVRVNYIINITYHIKFYPINQLYVQASTSWYGLYLIIFFSSCFLYFWHFFSLNLLLLTIIDSKWNKDRFLFILI